MSSVTEVILHCQKQIKKDNAGEEKLLHYLARLKRLRIKVKDLVDTGIGRTVNQLSRMDGRVGQQASDLVAEWKALVEAESSADSSDSSPDSPPPEPEDEEEEQDDEGALHIIDDAAVEDDEDEEDDDEEMPESPPPQTNPRHLNNYVPSPPEYNNVKIKVERDSDDDNRKSDYSSSHRDKDKSKYKEKDKTERERRELESKHNGKREREKDDKDNDKGHRHHSHSSSSHKHGHKSDDRHSSSKRSGDDELKINGNEVKKIKTEPKADYSPAPTAKSFLETDSSASSEESSEESDGETSDEIDSIPPMTTYKSSSQERERERERSSSSKSKTHHTTTTLDPNVKIKVENSSTDNRKSDHHHHHSSRDKEKDKSKSKEKKESHHSSSSKKVKDERESSSSSSKSHRHSHNDSSHKQGHKNGDRSSSKRKNDEELQKSENGIKKIKTEPRDEKQEKHKPKLVQSLSMEIDSTSGINFADVLSCLDQKLSTSTSSSKKKDKNKVNNSSSSSSSKTKSSATTDSYESSSSKNKRMAHEDKRNKVSSTTNDKSKSRGSGSKDADLSKKSKSVILPTYSTTASALISSNHKPSTVARIAPMQIPKPTTTVQPRDIMNGLRHDFNGSSGYPIHDGESRLDYERRTDEDALSTMIASRNQRTKVYSGVKSGVVGTIPKLFDLCIRVIQENINDLGYTGGVPYDILKPVLDRASADQLSHIENYNPYLIENTDELWKFHCSKEFRGAKPQELESWRELYIRCVDERQDRFRALTNKVKKTQETAIPQMKAKLAYVDTSHGPRFSKTKAATIKNGMKTLKTREEKGIKRTHGSSASAGGSNSQNVAIEEASVIISADSRAGSAPAPSRERESSAAAKKPKKAPLMQKTLKVIKTLFRR